MTFQPSFRLLRPGSAAEAVALHAEHTGSRFLAGGTDLLPNLRRGLVEAPALIDLSGLEELAELRREPDGALILGSLVSLERIARDVALAADFPALAQAAAAVAGPTHRASATVGGNLCLDTRCRFYNQSEAWREGNGWCLKLGSDICRVAPKGSRCYAAYSGDLAPALLVLDAQVELLGPEGRRCVPLGEFYRDDGMGFLDLRHGELLAAVRVSPPQGWRSGYEKMRVRRSLDFPLAGVAVALRREGRTLAGLRVACTGVASRPLGVPGLEACLGACLDAGPGSELVIRLEGELRRVLKVMDTALADAPYRRRIVPVLARRLIQGLWNG